MIKQRVLSSRAIQYKVVFILFLLLPGCQNNSIHKDCSQCKDENAGESKILIMERTIVFDTVTVVVEGKVMDVQSNKALPEAMVQINGHQTKSDKMVYFATSILLGEDKRYLFKPPVTSLLKQIPSS